MSRHFVKLRSLTFGYAASPDSKAPVMRLRFVISVFVVALMLTGCAASTPQEFIEQLPTIVPSVPPSDVVSAQEKAQNLSPKELYGLYAVPSSCTVTPMVGNERRRTFPAWWLDGDGMAAGTPIGVLFAGGPKIQCGPGHTECYAFANKIQWQLEQPGTLVISGELLDGQAPPLQAENIVPIGGATHSSAVIFPAPGCWRLHAEAGTQSLDATVYVYPYSCLPSELRGRQGKPAETLCRSPG